jgi:nitrogen fixation protein NifB
VQIASSEKEFLKTGIPLRNAKQPLFWAFSFFMQRAPELACSVLCIPQTMGSPMAVGHENQYLPGNGARGITPRAFMFRTWKRQVRAAEFRLKGAAPMAHACDMKNRIQGHPCFGGNRHTNGRMHLAVAPHCNIKCGYCTRKHDCANESRPGVTSRLLTPLEALEKVREVMASPVVGPIIKVIGIAGPGDPLANQETFATFGLIKREFPHLMLCMSTNGLLLPESVDRLHELGLHSLTVTINAVDAEVGGRIYRHISYHGRRFSGAEGAAILIDNQFQGLTRAAELGMTIKVNSVLIPGINEEQIPLIAARVRDGGAFVMNIMPLIPQADLAHVPRPSEEHLDRVRRANEGIIGQFSHCKQCRADAIGLIGADLTVGEPACTAQAA